MKMKNCLFAFIIAPNCEEKKWVTIKRVLNTVTNFIHSFV